MLINRSLWNCALIAFAVLSLVGSVVRAEETRPETLHRIAFGSCADEEHSQKIWKPLAASKPDLFLFVGDTIYANTEDMAVMKAMYDSFAATPGYQQLVATCPILGVWDDHDFGVNDGHAGYPKKAEAAKLLLDFFQVPEDSPRRKRQGVYESYMFGPEGKRVQIILLDTRYFRSKPKRDTRSEEEKKRLNIVGRYIGDNDPKATMLGKAQWKWLEEQLRKPADVRLLVSSSQVIADEKGMDSWGNFPRERKRLYKLIETTGAKGVVIVSGDVHFAEISRTDEGPYPLYDFTSSGLTHASKPLAAKTNNFRVSERAFGKLNYGLINIDWEAPVPTITMEVCGSDGKVAIEKTISLDELK